MISKKNDWAEAMTSIKAARRYIKSQGKPKVPYTVTCDELVEPALYVVVPLFKRCKNLPKSIEFPIVFTTERDAEQYVDNFEPCDPDCDNCRIDYLYAPIDSEESWFRWD